jgi:nitrogen fixation NifU-like protein
MGNVDYNEKVMDHFRNPRNMGELSDANAVATVGNPTCGDVMKIMMRIEDGVIEDVKFLTMGCAAAVASSSMATELVKGKTVEEVRGLTNRDVSLALGALPPIKEHCSNLAADAIGKALDEYEGVKS